MLAIFPITEVVQERKATFKEDAKEDGPKMFFISTIQLHFRHNEIQ